MTSFEADLIKRYTSPEREPAWRWWIAYQLSYAESEPDPGHYDKTTFRLIRLHREKAAGLFPRPPKCLHEMCQIGSADLLTQVCLEGPILAGCSPGDTVARTGISRGVLRWFELVCFDVRDRLDNREWVARRFRDGWGDFPLSPRSVAKFLRQVAYDCGVETFEEYLGVVMHGTPYAGDEWFSRYSPGTCEIRRQSVRRSILTELLFQSEDFPASGDQPPRWPSADTEKSARRFDPKASECMTARRIDSILRRKYGVDVESFVFFTDADPLDLPSVRQHLKPFFETRPAVYRRGDLFQNGATIWDGMKRSP